MNRQVKCKVESCHYYSTGNCEAREIMVNNDGLQKASTSRETICETFKPKSY